MLWAHHLCHTTNLFNIYREFSHSLTSPLLLSNYPREDHYVNDVCVWVLSSAVIVMNNLHLWLEGYKCRKHYDLHASCLQILSQDVSTIHLPHSIGNIHTACIRFNILATSCISIESTSRWDSGSLHHTRQRHCVLCKLSDNIDGNTIACWKRAL